MPQGSKLNCVQHSLRGENIQSCVEMVARNTRYGIELYIVFLHKFFRISPLFQLISLIKESQWKDKAFQLRATFPKK